MGSYSDPSLTKDTNAVRLDADGDLATDGGKVTEDALPGTTVDGGTAA
jgi:hypothetical protein